MLGPAQMFIIQTKAIFRHADQLCLHPILTSIEYMQTHSKYLLQGQVF